MMNLRQIEVFRAVMHAGTISGAASALHVSQPAVSRMIGHLEVKLSVLLFERTAGRLHATPEARALMREIDSAFRGIERVRRAADQLRYGVSSTLRIASNLSTSLDLVPRAVAALKKTMPGLHILVEIGTEAQITELLLAGACDVGVVAFTQSHHPALTAHRIGGGEVVCAMAAAHPLASCTHVRMDDLRQFDVISFGSDSAHGQEIARLLGNSSERARPTVEVRYAYLACSIAASGWGVALVDDMSVRRFERDGLVLRPLEVPLSYSAYALGSAEYPLSAAGRAIIDLLGEHWLGARVQLQKMRRP
jgi:DNA-binding transcriptional LysR family regulator